MNTRKIHLAASMLISCFSLVTAAHAREAAPGYVMDSYGNVAKSGYGECLHTGDWTPSMASVVGCDGATADTEVKMIRGSGSGLAVQVVMPTTAMFEFDSATLTDKGKETIESYRSALMPELSKAYAAIIIGHTDSQGDEDYNLKLSLKRAQAVRDYLVETGANPEKLRVVGRGEYEPIASNDSQEGRAENRRVEVVVVGEVRDLDALEFPSVALFERRSAELTEQGKKLIEENRQKARELMKSASYIEIIGHTDDVGDDQYNQELSEQRALSVFNYLAESGMDVSNVVVRGMGEKMPIASNNTDEGRAQNRRVEILLLGRNR